MPAVHRYKNRDMVTNSGASTRQNWKQPSIFWQVKRLLGYVWRCVCTIGPEWPFSWFLPEKGKKGRKVSRLADNLFISQATDHRPVFVWRIHKGIRFVVQIRWERSTKRKRLGMQMQLVVDGRSVAKEFWTRKTSTTTKEKFKGRRKF